MLISFMACFIAALKILKKREIARAGANNEVIVHKSSTVPRHKANYGADNFGHYFSRHTHHLIVMFDKQQ